MLTHLMRYVLCAVLVPVAAIGAQAQSTTPRPSAIGPNAQIPAPQLAPDDDPEVGNWRVAVEFGPHPTRRARSNMILPVFRDQRAARAFGSGGRVVEFETYYDQPTRTLRVAMRYRTASGLSGWSRFEIAEISSGTVIVLPQVIVGNETIGGYLIFMDIVS